MAERDRLPLVDGLTETVRDTEPFMTRLADFFEQNQGNAQEDITDGIHALERAFSKESNEKVKSRLATAILLIREGPLS